MHDNQDPSLSRRAALAAFSVPAVAASQPRSASKLAYQVSAASTQAMAGARVFNVRDFGAKGDGKTLDTAAVQAAIDAANKDLGGIVLIPAGDFVVGTTELKSNVTLHLSASGRLLGSGEAAHY